MVVLALALAVVVGVLIGYLVRRAGTPGPAIDDKESFMRSARQALAEGRRLVHDLEAISAVDWRAGVGVDDLQALIGRVDVFGSHMTQVTCIAPTAMDVRVSRSVAVAATAVGDALRYERKARLEPDGAPRPSTADVGQRSQQLALAVSDLGHHVEFL